MILALNGPALGQSGWTADSEARPNQAAADTGSSGWPDSTGNPGTLSPSRPGTEESGVFDYITLTNSSGNILTSSHGGAQTINLTNDNVYGVNRLRFNDTGATEGVD